MPMFPNEFKFWAQRIARTSHYKLTQRVQTFLQQTPPSFMATAERQEIINFLRKHLVGVFNADFVKKYAGRRVTVKHDAVNHLPYVVTDEGHRLYFKRGMKKSKVRNAYNALCMEQDTCSPHNYCFDSLKITNSTILADVGAAEANFSLKFIDIVQKVYLFERDPEWIEALQATFSPWKAKVTIINKYVANCNSNDFISLDSFFADKEKPTLLKMDIEGAEKDALDGATQLLDSKAISDLLVCTYHRHGDEQILSEYLRANGYTVIPSAGYMLFPKPPYNTQPPYDFRHGVVWAKMD